MPLFRRKVEEQNDTQTDQAERRAAEIADQEASLELLKQGGIPIQAQRRLDNLRREGGLFTSDLSVDEFVLSRQSGLRLISQVMGSSVYHVGWQYTPGGQLFGGYAQSMELETVTRAINSARALALRRMAEEAERIGANVVVGVRIERGSYDWATDLVEFSAIGTAASAPEAPAGGPALTNLSGQDYWKLRQAGFWPVGVVAGSTVYYVMGGWQTQMATSAYGSWANTELQDFTQGLYLARNAAMTRVYHQARELGAEGVVGMKIDQSERPHESRAGGAGRIDMIFTFHALGTAVVQLSTKPSPAISPVVAV